MESLSKFGLWLNGGQDGEEDESQILFMEGLLNTACFHYNLLMIKRMASSKYYLIP
jgi:hypothetical protein